VVPEESFSAALRSHLAADQRKLDPKLKRELVRKLVDRATSACDRPIKRQLEQIAAQVVTRYPVSLQDHIDSVVVGSGYDSLTSQLVSRVENVRRPDHSSLIRRKRAAPAEGENLQPHPVRKLKVIDGLGCVSWSPKMPDGESDDSQINHKIALQRMHKRGQWDAGCVRRLSNISYCLQRKEINSGMTMKTLKVQWPFLLKQTTFHRHVKELLGFDLHHRLQAALRDKTPRLISYFRTMKSVDLRHRLLEVDAITNEARKRNGLTPAVLSTLMAFFGEELSVLAIGAEVDFYQTQVFRLALKF